MFRDIGLRLCICIAGELSHKTVDWDFLILSPKIFGTPVNSALKWRLLLNVTYSGGSHPEMVQLVGGLMQATYREHRSVQGLYKFWGRAFPFWSY